jgi:hypothetical protein
MGLVRMAGVVALAGCLAGCASAGLPRRSWTHYEVGTVDVYSGMSETSTRNLLTDLAKFRVVVGTLSSAASVEPRAPTSVYIFPDQSFYEALGGPPNSAGYFTWNDERFIMALNGNDGRELLFHEYTHMILANVEDRVFPTWYHEGIAELMSTIRFVGDEIEIGQMPGNAAEAVANAPRWIPFEDLFAGSIFGQREDPQDLHFAYSQAWLVAYYFQLGPRAGTGDLERYLDLVNAGADPVEAVAPAWGVSIEAIEKEVRDHVARGRLTYRLIPASEFQFSQTTPTGTSMSVSDTSMQLAEMCRLMGRTEQAERLEAHAIESRAAR